MTLRGHIEKGAVVLDEPVNLPDGVQVRVEVSGTGRPKTPGEALMKYAGKAMSLPAEASENLEHYLYGHPKQ
jgi:hypothetical protein